MNLHAKQLQFVPSDLLPGSLAELNMEGDGASDYMTRAFEDGVKLLAESAEPRGILGDISTDDFSTLYHNEQNEPDTPVIRIYPKAGRLALFAFTLGGGVGEAVASLSAQDDLPAACMLDLIASAAVEKAVAKTERAFAGGDDGALLYSPGHCGWHISSQRQIFDYIHPETIGITLGDSFLMTPLKSVSGVILSGDRSIHRFSNDFSFCNDCREKQCRQRIPA